MSQFNNPQFPLCEYCFDGKNAHIQHVERPTARALREAWEDLVLARANLEKSVEAIPRYTGQWSDADYTRDEEQTFVLASNAFEDALVASVHRKT